MIFSAPHNDVKWMPQHNMRYHSDFQGVMGVLSVAGLKKFGHPSHCAATSAKDGDQLFRAGRGITLNLSRASLTALLFLTLIDPCRADPAPVIHYAPAENLEHVDVALIDGVRHEIDMAAYVLIDWPVMQALTRAADRGVKVRIYLDGTQLGERERAKPFQDLAETPTVEIRTKRDRGAPMHLKSYQIDGRLLRSGAANFSASGLKRQDNDLIVIESATAAAAFRRAFDARYASGDLLPKTNQ
jgi:phosphatidylserine/phosphatidylglycerophosphate/cardiolipin synthase-like enzyme